MPIYELDGQAPEFPADGQYWVAETAVLIGRVRLKSEAGTSMRLSNLTLPHGLARVLLAEQLYRAVSIMQNHPYHRE